MNEKINEIKRTLMDRYCVVLSKQHTQEYISYYFYLDYHRDIIKSYEKAHYQSKEGFRKKWKKTETEITIQDFLNNTVYDLLNRGYELENIG